MLPLCGDRRFPQKSMQDYREYSQKLTREPPAKTTTAANGVAHESVYHWRDDGSYIIGCVRRKNGGIVMLIKSVDFTCA
jgi:hypothetical protein